MWDGGMEGNGNNDEGSRQELGKDLAGFFGMPCQDSMAYT